MKLIGKKKVNRHFRFFYPKKKKKTLIVAAMVTSLSPTQLLLRDPRLWYFTHSHEILKIKYKLKLEA